MPANLLTFPPFRLDPSNACLWRGAKRIVLPPKDFAVLHYLVTHAEQIVTHEEILKAVWPDAVVSPKGLKAFVRRLRQALGDKAAKPRFIETVHRQGYRFIGTVCRPRSAVRSQNFYPALPLVGRDTELAQLYRWLDQAADGHRQLVFVTGEPGIGKTALLEAFVAGVQEREKSQKPVPSVVEGTKGKRPKSPLCQSAIRNPQSAIAQVWLGWGQCIEQYGTGEPYMPVLEALGRLVRLPDGDSLKRVLERHAPTWLVQMPALLTPADVEALQQRVLGATRGRMLREIAEALEVLTAERSLLLVLEDLHWADTSTLEMLAMLARRRESARLLVVGTYRPAEVLNNGHPLSSVRQELRAHDLCSELVLRLLSEDDVATYLQERFPHSVFPTHLAEVLRRRTEGNPLFVVSAIDDLARQGVLRQGDEGWILQGGAERLMTEVPESIRQLVARQRERLEPAEQQVLEAASVAGLEFSVAEVAAALEADMVAIGDQCAQLSERQQFLRPAGIAEWPDSTVAARYRFMHSLYQHLWDERVSVSRQQQWHARIGERKETAYGTRAGEIAAELAVHFEQGRDYPRAVHYLQQAGENALRRSANREAITYLKRGMELLQSFPDTPERTRQELGLQVALTTPLVATKGLGAAEVRDTHNRARELCQQIGETPELFPVLWGISAFYCTRAEWKEARTLVEQLLRLAQRTQDPAFLLQAYLALGMFMFCRGEFVSARGHLEQATLYNPRQYRSQAFRYGVAPEVFCCSYAAQVLWVLGYPEQALRSSREALTLAQEVGHPLSVAFALSITAFHHWYRREESLAQERAQEALTLATEHGFAEVLAWATVVRGWAQTGEREEGVLQVRQGLTACRVIGVELAQPSRLALLAEAHGKVGQTEEGLKVLAEELAQVDTTGERTHEAELYRLRGELTLAQSKVQSLKSKAMNSRPLPPDPRGEAEACFLKAIDIARRQQAKSLELRAVMSLSRLWQRQGRKTEARRVLAEVYDWFTEGFDTRDLQEAQALLKELV